MSDQTITFIETLVVVTCWCGTHHAIPQDLDDFQDRQFRDGQRQVEIYCPLGHVHVRAGKGEAERLRQQLERERAHAASLGAELDQTQASLKATKGVVTKLKKRAAAGVCPCCHRQFQDLRRHMGSKHPGYVETP